MISKIKKTLRACSIGGFDVQSMAFLVVPFLLIFGSSFFLFKEISSDRTARLELWNNELSGAEVIELKVHEFEKNTVQMNPSEFAEILGVHQITLDSRLDTYYLGYLITEFFPEVVLSNSIQKAVDHNYLKKALRATQNIEVDCGTNCTELEKRSKNFSVKIEESIEKNDFSQSILLWKEGIELFKSKVKKIIIEETKTLEKLQAIYFCFLILGLLSMLFAIFKINATAQINQAHFDLLKQLEVAQGTAKIGSWEFNLKTHALTWSKEHYKIFEIEMPQFEQDLYRLYREKIHPDDLAVLDQCIEKAVTHGEGFTYFHRVVLDRGNQIKYVQGIGQVQLDSNQKPEFISGTCQDITEQVLKEKENRFALDALGLGVWKFDPKTQALDWDRSMYRLFEIDPGQFTGHYQAWESSLTPEAKKDAVENLRLAIAGTKDFNTTFEIKVKSGKKKFIGGRGQVIRNGSGEAIMMYGINWDRTLEVDLERRIELERSKSFHASKLASLGEMSAGVAHEINNPLAVIVGNISLLEKFKHDPAKIASKIEIMHKSAERISRIVKGLTKFARASRQNENKAEQIEHILNEALMLTESKSKRYSTPVQLNLKSSSSIMCDAIEIEQVFVNLINNGIDAVKENSERWMVIDVFDEENEIVIYVIDSGFGISAEVEEKMFQPFYTTKPVGEGTGLGLSIAKGILEHHNASLKVRRDFKNTCFEVRFPSIKIQ